MQLQGQPPVSPAHTGRLPHVTSFHADRPGAIYDTTPTATGVIGFTEPTPEERELALGYPKGSTAAPSVTTAQRHTITGNSMDQRCLSHLLNHCLNTSAQQNVGHFFQPPLPVQIPNVIRGGEATGDPTHLSSQVAWLLACQALHTPVTLKGGEGPRSLPSMPRHVCRGRA